MREGIGRFLFYQLGRYLLSTEMETRETYSVPNYLTKPSSNVTSTYLVKVGIYVRGSLLFFLAQGCSPKTELTAVKGSQMEEILAGANRHY